MMYLVDSGVWIGAFLPKDKHHQKAISIAKKILEKRERVLITDLIFAEVVTYLRRKVGLKQSIEAAQALLDSESIKIAYLDEHAFAAAFHMFERYPRLSFADAASVAVMKDQGIREIISFDRGFDGIRDLIRLECI